MSQRRRLAALEALIDASGAAELFEAGLPQQGEPRQVCARTVLVGLALALSDGRPAHLAAGHRALLDLPVADQLRLGAAPRAAEGIVSCSYRQFAHTHQLMIAVVDPSPTPSFRGVPEDERAAHLAAARAGVDAEERAAALQAVVDGLVEASVPDVYKGASSSYAGDWTDHETWSRPRPKDDPQPANDPDASWGHAKRNAPGAVDHLFFGYYAQVVAMVADEGSDAVPELVRRIVVAPPRRDPAALMVDALSRAAAAGVEVGDVLVDCGYSNREPATWARPLRRQGARLVMDLHPNDRGVRGTFAGALLANGQMYCPATPKALLALEAPPRGASAEALEAHDASSDELARYKLRPISSPDDDGYVRYACPAAAGALRCPLKEASLALPADRPTVLAPPSEEPPQCCAQRTITAPPQVNEKTRQKHDYASRAHRLSYRRRTAAERVFASLSDVATGGIRRGWCRLFGLAKNTLMYALAAAVRNLRIVDSFEEARRATARKASTDAKPGRRRLRRYTSAAQTHSASPAVERDDPG